LEVTLDKEVTLSGGNGGSGRADITFKSSWFHFWIQTKTSSYPFTTLTPTVGEVNYENFITIKVDYLPGLIEGAHVNVGLGHDFLRE
jgi:GTPase involved in cell partitioning and DNA repair